MIKSTYYRLALRTVVFLFLISQINCKKSPPIDPPEESPYWGTCTAVSNGTPWAGQPFARFSLNNTQNFSIHIDSFNRDGVLKSAITFAKIPYSVGKYSLVDPFGQVDTDEAGMLLSFSIGDEPLGHYLPLKGDSTSYIEITEIRADSAEIKGVFQGTLLVANQPYSYSPDTIRFKNGQFHTRLIK